MNDIGGTILDAIRYNIDIIDLAWYLIVQYFMSCGCVFHAAEYCAHGINVMIFSFLMRSVIVLMNISLELLTVLYNMATKAKYSSNHLMTKYLLVRRKKYHFACRRPIVAYYNGLECVAAIGK